MRRVAGLTAPVLAAIIVGMALYLKLLRPELHRPWLAALMASEPVHVVAHLFLYGSLTLLLRVALRPRKAIVFAAVLVVGVLQEAAQVFHARTPGGPELFDLAVDAVAATIVLVAFEARSTVRDRRVREGAESPPPSR